MQHGGRFEVEFVGSDARVDLQSSGEWLQQATNAWAFPTHIKVWEVRSPGSASLVLLPQLVLVIRPWLCLSSLVRSVPMECQSSCMLQ